MASEKSGEERVRVRGDSPPPPPPHSQSEKEGGQGGEQDSGFPARAAHLQSMIAELQRRAEELSRRLGVPGEAEKGLEVEQDQDVNVREESERKDTSSSGEHTSRDAGVTSERCSVDEDAGSMDSFEIPAEFLQAEQEEDPPFVWIDNLENFLADAERRLPCQRGDLELSIDRIDLVDQVHRAFLDMDLPNSPPDCLFQRLRVAFENEEGIDAGGLTTDMFTEYFRRVCREKTMFQQRSHMAIPIAGREQELNLFGQILAKALALNRKMPPLCICPYVMRQLSTSEPMAMMGTPSVEDLHYFDPVLARSLETTLFEENVEDLMLPWADVPPLFRPEFVTGEDLVTTDTVHQYVQAMVESYFLGPVSGAVEAIRRGLWSVFGHVFRGGPSTTFMIDVDDWVRVSCGLPDIDVDDLLASIEFEASFGTDEEPTQLRQDIEKMLREWKGEADGDRKLHSFVEYATSSPLLTEFVIIHIVPMACEEPDNKLPEAATCSSSICVPSYSSIDVLRDRFNKAFEHMGDGFWMG